MSDINLGAAKVETDIIVEAARVEASGVTAQVACDDSGAVSAQGDAPRELDGAEKAQQPEDGTPQWTVCGGNKECVMSVDVAECVEERIEIVKKGCRVASN